MAKSNRDYVDDDDFNEYNDLPKFVRIVRSYEIDFNTEKSSTESGRNYEQMMRRRQRDKHVSGLLIRMRKGKNKG